MTKGLDGKRLYLDSNVFIYAFEATVDPIRRAATDLLRAARRRQCIAVTSLLSRAEVLVRPVRMQQVHLADRYRRLLSGADAVEVCAVDARIVDTAASLRADYATLRLPDAVHVATAMHGGCDIFITADRRLAAVKARIAVVLLEEMVP